MTRTVARLCAALFTLALVGIAGPVSAHVNVSSTDAAQGGFGKVVFRVPTESDTASTTKLVVTLPKEAPFAFVSVGAKPGWKIETTTAKLDQPTKVGNSTITEAISTISWTATGDGIAPSQFDEFAISGGPFPDADQMAFSAVQTYSDGKVVAWDQPQTGDAEPEHPAPALTLVASTGDDSESTAAEDTGNGAAPWLAGGALLVAAVALLVALRQNRRRA